MKIIFWILLGIGVLVVLFFGTAVIAGIVEEIKKGKNPADSETEKKYKEKYKNAAALKKYKGEPLSYKLLQLGRDALKEGDLETAREYLEDSRVITDSTNVRLALVACYAAGGDREQAINLLNENPGDCGKVDTCFAALLLHQTDRPVETLVKGRALAKEGGINGDLYRAASAQVAQDVLESYDAMVREARERAEAGDPAGAADFYKALYYTVSDAAGKEVQPKYQETLTELAMQTAICCCEAGKYDDAKIYADWRKNTHRHPLYKCVKMLAVTHGGARTIKSEFSCVDLDRGIPVAERAVREGIPGAEQVRKMLKAAIDEAIASEAVEASWYLEELAFEEAHGMSREEYKQRQKEAAEEAAKEQARAERADRLRKKVELAEREADIRSGGRGYSMEEKLIGGEISYSDYETYSEAKEKYIKKKSQ